ncbi:MAG TPA: cytochrome c [Ignavibacteriaceae bacterium]|nr:cytochrome c [Ignavibacteriaceae bacterium]
MTKTQIWLASFLVLFVVLFLLGKALKKDEQPGTNMGNPVPQSEMSSTNQELTGMQIIERSGCTGCHGVDLKGTRMGPKLTNLSSVWSRDELINYLRNPSAYMDKGRFLDYQKNFPNIMMPSYNNIDVKDLGKIADYILQLK